MRRAVSRRSILRVECLEDRTTPVTVPLFAAGAGAGGPPLVNVYSMDTPTSFHKVAAFYAYESSYRGGVFVATSIGLTPPNPGEREQGSLDPIVTAGPGGPPEVWLYQANLNFGSATLRYTAVAEMDRL